jgi:hypothetical protein
LRGDGFAVALVHLATVGFYENAGHFFRESRYAANAVLKSRIHFVRRNHILIGSAAFRPLQFPKHLRREAS